MYTLTLNFTTSESSTVKGKTHAIDGGLNL